MKYYGISFITFKKVILFMGKGKYLRQEKVSTGKKIGRVALIIVLVVVLLLGAVAAFVWSKLGKITYHESGTKEATSAVATETVPDVTEALIQETEEATEPEETEVPAESAPLETLEGDDLLMLEAPSYSSGELFDDKNVMNILLVGTDERTEGFVEACRADINILVSINKSEKTVKLVSFSRGIAIKMTDGPYKGSYEWLTNAQRWAGPIAVMQEFENNFKIKLDRYVRVNFNTVEVVVDAMDGLNLELTEEEVKFFKKHRDWDFEVGMNNLNGWQALQYARLRGVDDDWHRMERQRKCILAVVNQLKGSSFAELNELCDIVLPLVQTNLTKMEIAELILYSPNFLKSEFDQMTIPIPNSYGGMACFSGVSGWALDYNKNNAALHEFLFGTDSVQ